MELRHATHPDQSHMMDPEEVRHRPQVDDLVDVGGPGVVTVDGTDHRMAKGACLYIGRGAQEVRFASDSSDARFDAFFTSAHTELPTTLVEPGPGTVQNLGDQKRSNRPTLNQHVHENGVRSCHAVTGVTTIHEGSMWVTLPDHTHDRRTECYLYPDRDTFHVKEML